MAGRKVTSSVVESLMPFPLVVSFAPAWSVVVFLRCLRYCPAAERRELVMISVVVLGMVSVAMAHAADVTSPPLEEEGA